MKLWYFLILIIVLIVVIVAIFSIPGNSKTKSVTVYKDPECSCCEEYIKALESNGFEVDLQVVENMPIIKQENAIPEEMQSCHTTVYGEYFIEGHVPLSVFDKLDTEKPAIDGVAVPGMPSGSLGMGGIKKEPFTIYQVVNGVSSEYYLE